MRVQDIPIPQVRHRQRVGLPAATRAIGLLLACVLLATACGGTEDQPTASGNTQETATPDPASTDPAEAEEPAVSTPIAEATATEIAAGEEPDEDASEDADHYEALPECLGRDVAFSLYAESLTMSCDDEFLYIEAESVADHEMMVGITAWNEQVPLPQDFFGSNSWAVPLNPTFNDTTVATTGQGPVAVAINGVMVFNPTQQSGVYTLQTDPNLIGELDSCGGHAGRGDDYHYHVSPNCLEADHLALDADFQGIVAYALDGYPIYSNAAIPADSELDECGGLGTTSEDYRYFASAEFPYVNGCFRGDFDMNLQPQAPSIRQAGTPRQTEITALYIDDDGVNHLEFIDDGVTGSINWIRNADDCFDFEFVDDVSTGTVRLAETYCRSAVGEQGGEPPARPEDPPGGDERTTGAAEQLTPSDSSTMTITSSAVVDSLLLGEFQCETKQDGVEDSIPLEWSGVPAGTTSLAIAMHHYPNPDDTTNANSYLALWNIDPSVSEIEHGEAGNGDWFIGSNKDGNAISYTSPCSPNADGSREYTITIYALSETPAGLPTQNSIDVDRDALLASLDAAAVLDLATLTFNA